MASRVVTFGDLCIQEGCTPDEREELWLFLVVHRINGIILMPGSPFRRRDIPRSKDHG